MPDNPVHDPHATVPIPAQKTNYIKDSDYGPSQLRLPIQYNPANYNNCESAAKAFYEALKPVVEAYGQNPETELFISPPDKTAERGYGRQWQVSWEAGPYEWGIVASMDFMFGNGWYTEPYYSFDLCFTED